MKNRKVCFVTGAAEGLGLFLTEGLLENGYQVAAIFPEKDAGKKSGPTPLMLHSMGFCPGENLLTLTVDLTNENNVQKAIQQTIRRFGRIDLVVNAAGYHPFEKVSGFSDAVKRNFEEQLFGGFYVLRQVAPYLRDQGSGHIFTFPFNVTFTPGFTSTTDAAIYSTIYTATQLAVENLSGELTGELKTRGIRFTTAYPERPGTGHPEPDLYSWDLYSWVFQKIKAVQLNTRSRKVYNS